MSWIKGKKLRNRLLTILDEYSYLEFINYIKSLLHLKEGEHLKVLFYDDYPIEYQEITNDKCIDQKETEVINISYDIISVYVVAGEFALFKKIPNKRVQLTANPRSFNS